MARGGTDFFEHPEYTRSKDDWQTWKDLYEGKHAVLVSDRYLWRHELENHPVEGKKLRQLREQRSRNLNLMEPVLSIWSGLFFREDPAVDESVKELFGDAYDDVDGEGNSFVAFLKGPALLNYLRDGKATVYTDATEFNGETKADEEGHRAYFTAVPALSAKDWVEDPGSARSFLLFRYEYIEVKPRADLTTRPVEVLRTRVLKRNGASFIISDYERPVGTSASADRWTLVARKSVPLGFLPLAVATGESWVKDVAELQLVLFNLLSAYYNQLNHQAFQRPVFSGNLDTDQKKAWSEFSALVVPQGTEVTVIEPSDTTALENAIEKTIDRLFKVALNRTQALASNTKQVAAADTIRELKDELLSLVTTSIADLERLANQMVQHYAAFKGRKDFQGKVTLSREVSEEDLEQQLKLFAILRGDISQVLPWRKAVLKKMLAKQNLSEKEETEIRDEIDKLKPLELVHSPISLPGGVAPAKKNGGQEGSTGRAVAAGGPPSPTDGSAG